MVAGRWLLLLGLLGLSGCAFGGARRGRSDALNAERSSQVRALSDRAQAAIDRGDLEQARGDLVGIIQIAPDSAEALYRLGTVLKLEGRAAEAESAFRKALARDSDYVLAMVGLSEVEAERGETASALKRIETAIEIDPTQSSAHRVLGRILELQGRTDEALAEYFRVLEYDPNNAEIGLRIATIQLARNQADQALSRLDQVIELAPENGHARDVRGLAYLKLGLLTQAIADFRGSLERRPNHPETLVHLAYALERDGKPAEARRTVAIALRLAPHHPAVRGLAEKLALLPSSPRTSFPDGAAAHPGTTLTPGAATRHRP